MLVQYIKTNSGVVPLQFWVQILNFLAKIIQPFDEKNHQNVSVRNSKECIYGFSRVNVNEKRKFFTCKGPTVCHN